ncbi:magnesium protoporphyrin IX methyltransferase [bacterium]|nr:MAG: magnesium protoporphyrin IX methyltransferase [bacterium]
MQAASYQRRRGELETYFDRTAADAWARLTSDAPVGRIRAHVRAGRDRMRATLLDLMPSDLRGRRILDAGCGTGALALEAARRGAEVVAIDLSDTLVTLARSRLPADLVGRVQFRVGDMFEAIPGPFDHVVAMDSLIHYRMHDAARVLEAFALKTRESIVFTFVPSNPALATLHAIGRLFPRGDRSPAVEPVAERSLVRHLRAPNVVPGFEVGRTARVSGGFYVSQALELKRA